MPPACAAVKSATRQNIGAHLDDLGKPSNPLKTEEEFYEYIKTLTKENLGRRDDDGNCVPDLFDAIVAHSALVRGRKIEDFIDYVDFLQAGVDTETLDPDEAVAAFLASTDCFKDKGDKGAISFFRRLDDARNRANDQTKSPAGVKIEGTVLEKTKHPEFIELTLDNVDKILKSSKPTIIDIWADWYPLCHVQSRILAELLEKNPDVYTVARYEFVDGNEEMNRKILDKLGIPEIEEFPTLMMKIGDPRSLEQGLHSIEDIETIFRELGGLNKI